MELKEKMEWRPYRESSEKSVRKYFDGDELATKVYRDKYENFEQSIKGSSTPDDMHKNLASIFNKIERNYNGDISKEVIYSLLKDFKYIIPGGSVMYGLNRIDKPVSLSNCFVIGNEDEKDSYGAIMRRDEEQIQLMKRRGGVGHDLSFIRPAGSIVNNSARTSTGVVPFADRYSRSIKEVAQDGRRGAGMLTIDFHHPDARNFIDAKANTDKITGANISVKIHDESMDQLANKLAQEFYDKNKKKAGNPRRGVLRGLREIRPDVFINEDDDIQIRNGERDIDFENFKALIKNARDFSEPGILFWDRVREQIDYDLYRDQGFGPISTNPCGELPLSGYEACRLLSLVVYNYIKNPFTENAEFDFELFEEHAELGQKILDDIVDLEIIKINIILKRLDREYQTSKFQHQKDTLNTEINLWKKIAEKTINGRRTGLGYTAIGDAIAALGMRFGSKESIDFTEEVTKTLMRGSYRSSIKMAKDRGAFPVYNKSEFNSRNSYILRIKSLFYDEPEILEMWEKYGRRNIQNLAIAPTGSLSILAKTSSGIEPVFSLRYTRRRRVLKEEEGVEYAIDDNNEKWEEFVIVHHKLQEWYNITHKEKLDLTTVSKEKFDEIVKDSPYYGSTAHEIEPSSKITLQGAAQKWIDSSISNTLNLPEDVTEEKVLEYALFAWETGTKGFTIYREGSRGGILITDKLNKNNFSQIDAAKRPEMLQCEFHNFMIDNVSWIVLVGLLNDKPYEIFAFKDDFLVPIDSELVLQKVKSRHYRLLSNGKTLIEDINDKFETPEEEFITRLISTSLRHGTHVKFITEQLTKSAGYISDFRSAIARVLIQYVEDDEMASKENCPECSQVLSYENGCVSCKACGYTKC